MASDTLEGNCKIMKKLSLSLSLSLSLKLSLFFKINKIC